MNVKARPDLAIKVQRGAAVVSALLAGAVLVGWSFKIDALTQVITGHTAMNPMTAITLLLGSIALVLRLKQNVAKIRILALIMLAIGGAKLAQIYFGTTIGVDQLIFNDQLGRTVGMLPNRMAPNTAFAICLVAIGIFLGVSRRNALKQTSHLLAMLTIAITLFTIIGYALGIATFYRLHMFNAMALHTAVGLMALSVGIISMNPRIGLMRIIGDAGPAGSLSRSVLPLSLMVPILVGLVRLSGERFGFYGSDDGVALQVFANVLATFTLLMCSIVALYRTDMLRRERESSIVHSEARYRIAETIGHVGHWRVELPSMNGSWSDQFRVICGLPEGTPPSVDAVLKLYHPDDVENSRAAVKLAARDGVGWDASRRVIRPSGELRYVRSHGVCEHGPNGDVTAIFGVFVDVTELELARQKAESAMASKAAFLANMSHEIRTPMNGIMGFAELMLGTSLDADQRHHVGLIHESSKALLKLLNEILDVSKMDAGQLEVVPEPFDLGHGVRQCVRLMSPMAEQKKIALDVEIDPDLPRIVLTDGLRLRQILLNLLGNAVKFTSSGSVHLDLRETRDSDGRRSMVITVVDTGVGIDEDRMDAVFETFAQADSTISRRFGGSGLGLSISRRLAELLGGTIDLANRPGGGTIATLKLPLVEAEAYAVGINRSRVRESLPMKTTKQRPVSVLVVEDLEINREVVTVMLTRLGHNVDIAEDGAVALEMAKRLAHEPDAWDLILMDVQMPVMDGLTATRAIRTLGGRAASIPIVGLSASAFAAEIQECLDAGMVDHAAKPIASNALESIVARWTGEPVPALVA